MSSFIQGGPKLCSLEEELRMASTAKPSSTRALLDERMDLGGGRRQRRYPPSFKWGRYCARCGTVSLLDERLTITARKWAEVAAARTIEAGEHC